jgi:hypothetical protein
VVAVAVHKEIKLAQVAVQVVAVLTTLQMQEQAHLVKEIMVEMVLAHLRMLAVAVVVLAQ